MCTRCNQINNKVQKLPFNSRPTCSRKGCFHQSSYKIKGKYLCFNHAKTSKAFTEFVNLKKEGCTRSNVENLETSRLTLLNNLFDNVLQSVKEL